MKSMLRFSILFKLSIFLFLISAGVCFASSRLELRDPDAGREIFAIVLTEGEPVVLTWLNSLFGLFVTERFEVRGGALFLTEVTYDSPGCQALPVVPPEDAEVLYQTGGPFHAPGLAKPFREIVFRISEIGEPKMKIRDRMVDFKKEVGFGGRIILTVTSAESP
jgi:hypothetical protein